MSNSKYKILFVDANESELNNLMSAFSEEGFVVKATSHPEDVVILAQKERPHLIMLDLVLPMIDGIDICTDIKRDKLLSRSLIVFYSSREDDYSQIAAFDAGADDYIVKPKQKRVLISRINALLKRHNGTANPYSKSVINGGSNDIIIDKERFLVIKKGVKIPLPRKEFQLLVFLAETPQKVFSRKEISQFIWGTEQNAENRTIDVHIRRLRKKIGVKYIETIKGVGYKVNL